MSESWIDWSALQERIPEDEQSSFRQEFLQLARPAPERRDEVPYMNDMTEAVQATLAQLERDGKAKSVDGRLLVDGSLVPASFRRYL